MSDQTKAQSIAAALQRHVIPNGLCGEAAAELCRLEHNNRVLMDALWKACGDDEDVVNAYIESQGELK